MSVLHDHKTDLGGVERFFARQGVDPIESAFEADSGPHPGSGGLDVPADEVAQAWDATASVVDHSNRRALYVHTPFCRSRCSFCPFYTYHSKDEDLAAYAVAILREIDILSDSPIAAGHPIHSVYFGGGTPTDYSADDLRSLIAAIRGRFPLANDCEITIEGRVSGFTEDKMRACIDAGANRFSIGVQTFDTQVRHGVGRRADTGEVLSSLETLCSFDSAAIVIDLIYGLPGQTLDVWENDVETFIHQTGAHGIDMYKLKMVPGSVFTESGKSIGSADRKQMGQMLQRGGELMDEHGFRRLSNCHWGRGTRERNRYNTDTAFRSTCIPIGCGAGGRVGNYMFFQESDLARYHSAITESRKPIATATKLPPHSDTRDEIAGQVSLGTINLNTVPLLRETPLRELSMLLGQWEQSGLIELASPVRGELTTAGRFWSNKIARSLIDYTSNTGQH